MSKTLQKKKIILLKFFSKKNNARKIFANRIRIDNSTLKEIVSFQILQFFLSKFIYLIHHNVTRQIYINLNVNKKFDIETIIYHLKKKFCNENYSSRFAIKFILFLSRFLNFAKTKYWLIELKFVDIIWILKKIKHLIKFSFLSIVVYINHDIVLRLTKQTILIISSTNKINFRLIRVNDYIQRFEFQIRYKFDKIHIVSNVLFKFVNLNKKLNFFVKNELNVLFILIDINIKSSSKKILFINFLIKINFVFRQKILDDYQVDFQMKTRDWRIRYRE